MPDSVITIDCQYIAPGIAAAYLLIHEGRAVFIENNTRYAVPHMLQALASRGLTPQDVEYAVITHVHLDHAGGSSALMEACPNAQLLCHPRAARHVVDPARLVAGSREVYGAERFDELYGEVGPVAAERVRSMNDDEVIDWHGRNLQFLHTPGHASHHMVIVDGCSDSVFTGDAFGVCYPPLQTNGTLVLPTSPPTDFDPELSRQSVRRIMQTGCRQVFPTHFAQVDDPHTAADQLIKGFDFLENLLLQAEQRLLADMAPALLLAECFQAIRSWVGEQTDSHRLALTDAQWQLLELDIELNAQGIVFAAGKRVKCGMG